MFLELSRNYIQLTRDKVSEKPGLVLKVIYEVLLGSIKMLATIAPFISEQIYLNLKSKFGLKTESIHLLDWPDFNEKSINEILEKLSQKFDHFILLVVNNDKIEIKSKKIDFTILLIPIIAIVAAIAFILVIKER